MLSAKADYAINSTIGGQRLPLAINSISKNSCAPILYCVSLFFIRKADCLVGYVGISLRRAKKLLFALCFYVLVIKSKSPRFFRVFACAKKTAMLSHFAYARRSRVQRHATALKKSFSLTFPLISYIIILCSNTKLYTNASRRAPG